jgi:hypothetical protein
VHQRVAMCQIYALCRAVDDIADCSAARAQRLRVARPRLLWIVLRATVVRPGWLDRSGAHSA